MSGPIFEHDIIIMLVTFLYILILSLGIGRAGALHYWISILFQGIGTVCVLSGLVEGYAFFGLSFAYLIGYVLDENLSSDEVGEEDITKAGCFDNFIVLAFAAYLFITVWLMLFKHNSYLVSLIVTLASVVILVKRIRSKVFKGSLGGLFKIVISGQEQSDEFIYKIAEGSDHESIDFTGEWKEKEDRRHGLDESGVEKSVNAESEVKNEAQITIENNGKMQMMLCSQCGAKVKKEGLKNMDEYLEVKCSYCGSTNFFY